MRKLFLPFLVAVFTILSLNANAQTVTSITRADSDPTNAATVNFTVVFQSATTGVVTGNFTLDVSGTSGSIGTPTTADNITWNVPVSTVTGDGTLSIDFVSGSESPTTAGFTAGEAYTVDNTNPTFDGLNSTPNDDATGVSTAADIVVDFDEDIAAGTGNVTVRDVTGAANFEVFDITLATATTTPAAGALGIMGDKIYINPTNPLLEVNDYAIRIDATAIDDLSGNSFAGITNDTDFNFTSADETAPTFNSAGSTPVDDATGISTTADIIVDFSEDIAGGTGNITLRDVTGASNEEVFDVTTATATTTPTAGNIGIMNDKLYINPTNTLAELNVYAVQIAATAIDDLAGNSFAGITDETTHNFTTGDFTNPSFDGLNSTPNDDATGVATAADIIVDFDEDIAAGTGNVTVRDVTGAANFEVFDITLATATTTPAAGALGIMGDKIYINPTSALTEENDYSIRIDATAVDDLSGNSFVGITNDTDFNFTSADETAPTFNSAGSTPVDDATGISTTADIIVDFSEDIAGGTGNITLRDVTGASNEEVFDVTTATATTTPTAGNIGIMNDKLYINPTNTLAELNVYAVQIAATAVDDVAGNSFAGITNETDFNFTTGDFTNPSFDGLNSTPNDDATGVTTAADIVVDFDEDITAGTGNVTVRDVTGAANFEVFDITLATATTTPAAGALGIMGDKIYINPTSALTEENDYSIRIDATAVDDLSGNSFVGITNDTDFNFTSADETAPTFVDATFYDTDGNGSIDEILLEFSEDIDESSVDDADFNIGGAGFGVETFTVTAGASAANGVDANDTDVYVTLAVDITGTTDQTIVYTQNDDATDVADDAGNQALDNAGLTTIDLAAPVIISAVTGDAGGTAGQIDQIVVTFSEDIEAGDVDEVPTVVAGDDFTDDFTIAGYDISGVLPSGGSGVDGNQLIISLTESGSGDTGATPNVTLNATQLNDLATAPNAATAYSASASDGADPILLSSSPSDNALDVGLGANVILTFSENVVAGTGNVDIVDVVLTDDRTIAIGSTTILSNQVTIDPGANLQNFRNYAVQIDATALDDASGNSYSGIADNTTLDFMTIGATPTFDVTWLDNSGDGDIDQVQIDFSEAISITDNTTGDVFDVFSFTGGITVDNVVGFGATDDFGTVSGVTQLVLNVSGVTGTSSPSTTITYNQSSDEEIRADVGNQEIADLDNPGTVTDGASPVLLSAITDDNDINGQIDRIVVTFSETMEADDIDGVPTVVAGDDFTDDFVVTGFDIASVATLAGGSTDDDEIVIVLTESGTPDTDATPNLAITVGELGDLATVANTNAASSGATIDGANPVIISATTDDVGGTAGEIDLVTVVLSETIDGSTLDQTVGGGTTSQFALSGGYDISSIDTQAGGAADDNVIEIVLVESTNPDTDATPNLIFTSGTLDDLATPTANTTLGYSAATTDGAAPAIYSSFLQSSNSFLQVVFSEEISRTGAGSILLGDFDQSIILNSGPNPTTLNFSDATTLGGDPLGAAEDTILFVINIDPGFGTYEGDDDVSISTDGTTIEDAVGNALPGTETAGPYTIQDLINFPQILSASYTATGANSGYIELVFNEGLFRDASTNRSPMLANTNNDGTIKSGDYTNGTSLCDEDELCITYTQNGGATINDNNNSDIEWRDDTGTILPNNQNYSSDTYRIYFLDLPNGQFRGVETYRFAARNNTQIRGRTTDAYMPNPGDYFFDFNLPDAFAEDFDDLVTANVEAHDTDADGNIDEIVVTFLDDIDDATLAASLADFTIVGGTNNGISPTSVVATALNGVDPNVANDNIFTLGFTNYTGTAVDGDLDFGGTLTFADDAGNLILAGSVTPTDAAGPAIISAITADNDLNGQIDEITVTFSEAFADLGIDDTDFSLSGGYTIQVAGFAVASPDVTLTLDESGASDTYITPNVTVVASILEDLSTGAVDNPAQTFTNTDDGAAPYFTINSAFPTITNDPTPDLSGTIDDPNATVLISIGANSAISATNDGVGNWTLSGSLLSSPLDLQVYSVSYTTFDLASPINIRSATVANVIDVQGGVVFAGPNVVNLCIGSEETLSAITLTETAATDFSATGDLILNLPAGFIFNTGSSPSVVGNGGDVTIGTVEYIGNSAISIELINDGTDNDSDVITITGLTLEATGSIARSNRTISIGGDNIMLTSQTSFGDLSSQLSPAALATLVESTAPGTPITSYTARYVPRVTINYNVGPTFANGENFVFSGGATATMVSGTNTGTQMDVYLNSGTVGSGETITGQSSAQVGTTNTAAIGVTEVLRPFTLVASPTGTANWYNSVGGLINSLSSNNNTTLAATSPGLYTYEITDDDGTCESDALQFNVLVYDDVHPDNDESTFVNRSYSVVAARDTIFLSNPTGHTVNVTGNGISIVGGGADPLQAIFDPAIAGDDGAGGPQSHTITYSVTNNTTMESISRSVTFEVVPETEFFDPGLADAYCIDDFPLAGNLTIEDANFWVSNPANFFQVLFDNSYSKNVRDGDENNAFMFFYNNALNEFNINFGDYEIPFDPSTWSALPFNGFGNGIDYAPELGEGSVFYVERYRFDNTLGTTTIEFDYMEVYGQPEVAISNVNPSYCEDETLFTVQRDAQYITSFTAANPDDQYTEWLPNYVNESNAAIANGYELWKETATPGIYALYEDFTGADALGSGMTLRNTFDPTDPDQDLNTTEDETGNYRIIYVTEDDLTPVTCSGSTSFDFTIYPLPSKLELSSRTLTDGGSVGFVNTDEYLLEYCIFDAYHSGFALDGTTVTIDYTNLTGGSFSAGQTIFSFSTFAGLPGSSALGTILTDNGTSITMTNFGGEFLVGTHIRNSSSVSAEITNVTYSAADVTWYDEDMNVIPGSENIPVLGADKAGLNLDALRRFGAAETQEFFFSTTSGDGCESELRKVTVTVYGREDAVELTLPGAFDEDLVRTGAVETSLTYTLDYCTNAPGGVATPDDFTLPTLSGNDEYRVFRYLDDGLAAGAGGDGVDGFNYLGFNDYTTNIIPVSSDQPSAIETYRYYVYLRSNINPASNFAGCLSNLTTVFIEASDIPTAPSLAADFTTLSSLDLHVCEGGAFSSFVNSASGIDEYVWYAANGTDEILRVSNGSNLTSANLLTDATLAQYDNNTPGIYTFQVSRIQGTNDSRGFIGCESAQTTVTIEVHSIEGPPTIAVQGGTFADTDGNAADDNYHYVICLSELDQTQVLEASSAFGDPKDFNWYASDAGASVGALLFTDPDPNATNPTFNNLGLNSSNITTSQSRYFVVTQKTDVDDFGGCENFTTGKAFIQVQFVDDAALSFEPVLTDIDVSNEAEVSSNNQYCYDEPNIVIDLQADGSSITGGDLAGLSYTIESYLSNNYPGTALRTQTGSGNPTLDLNDLHTDASVGGNVVGGLSTIHVVTMDFINTNGCTNTISTALTIYPDPDITFTISGSNNADPDGTTLCYDDDPITLRGISNERRLTYSAATGAFSVGETVIGQTSGATGEVVVDDGSRLILTNVTGSFDAVANETIAGQTSTETATLNATTGANLSLATGVFSKTGAGLGTTSNNEVVFDPTSAHGGDPFAVRSTHTINFTYTDDNGSSGCQYVISKTFYVDPRPETIAVSNGSPEDGDEIHFNAICNDGGNIDVYVRMIDPADGVTEITDYTGYNFTWTVGTTTFPVVNDDNNFSFASSNEDLEIDVLIEDPNGCTVLIEESHSKQSLPDLIMNMNGSSTARAFELCSDDANPTVDVLDNNSDLASPGSSINPADVVSWSITSSNSSGSVSGLAAGTGAGTLPSTSDLDLQTLHENAGGNLYVDFGGGILRSVGGDTTYHDISIVYTDPEIEYQGVNTNCSNTVTRRLTIFPNPNVNFTVDGAYDDNIEFCYQSGNSGNITLKGVEIFANDTVGLSRGQFFVDGATVPTNNGEATINAAELLGDQFDVRTEFLIEYRYTDQGGTGCSHFFEKSIFVNPLPEFDEVVGGSEAGDQIFFTSICNDGGVISVEVQLIDPTDGAGAALVSDYTGYIFDWTIGSINQTVNDDNTFSFSTDAEEFTVEVFVTDPIGCFNSVTETHQKQDLPNLDFPEIFVLDEYCSDDFVTMALTLEDEGVQVNASDVLSWEVISYATSNIDTVGFNPIQPAWADATVAQDADGGSIPQIDLQTWHEGAGGNTYVGGKSIGGASTVHSIYITYRDPNRTYQNLATTCEVTYAETIIINPSPDISFTLNEVDAAGLQFCYDETGISLEGTDAVTGGLIGAGTFTIPGLSLSTNSGEAVFNAADAHDAFWNTFYGTTGEDYPYEGQSNHPITYEYTDDNGCTHSVTKTLFINPRPEFIGPNINDDIDGIQVANSCASDNIKVYVEMTDNKDLYIFEWSVNGIVEQTLSGSAEGDTLEYALSQGETTANFSVTATYDPGAAGATFTTSCEASSLSKSVTVGQEPVPAISWVGLTANHPRGTDFTLYQDNSALGAVDVDIVELYIGGNLINSWNNDDPTNPINFPITDNYSFTASGTYSVDLRITTSAGCDVTITRDVNILPHFTSFNSTSVYDQDFNAATAFELTSAIGGWHVETRSLDGKSDDLITTWDRRPNPPGTGNATDAVYTLYNTITNPEQNREISFVYSPSFDISGFLSPTISINRYSGFDSFRDGAVLQYTEDDGRTWQNVGAYDALLEAEGLASTPGWYDREAITAAPGTQAPAGELGQNNQGIGWATEKGTDGSDWQLGISPLGVNDPAFVRFRFALSGQAGEKGNAEGFGFDDFRIYDRDQIVLVELFSSTLRTESMDFNNAIDANPDFTGTDVLTINYFTDFANTGTIGDQLNSRNSKDPGAKSSFYGISDVPSIAISGDAFLIENLTDAESELEARLDNAKLEEPIFDINLITNVTANNNLEVSANFTSTTDLASNAKVGLFIAVVEPQITVSVNGSDVTLNNVLRKMLPSAAGQYEAAPIVEDDVLSISTLTWPINNMYTPGNFRVIAYVQDLRTKKIYQATSQMVTGGSAVLGLDDELEDFSLYPNPADKEVTVEFANPLSEETDWIIFDQAGREVLKGELSVGTKTITVQTTDLPSGLYFIHLYGEDDKRQSKRVIILH